MASRPAGDFPEFLSDYGSFLSHVEGLLGDRTAPEKGQRFAEFAQALIPHVEIGKRFDEPEMRQPSHDGGVDLEAVGSEDPNEVLRVQSKYTIRGVDDLDSIFSKFHEFEQVEDEPLPGGQTKLFKLPEETDEDETVAHYMVFTASKLKNTIKLSKYENSTRYSVEFYQRLKEQQRLHILDGPTIVPIARSAYKRKHFIPTDVELKLAKPYIVMGNVYIGILSGAHLKDLYQQYGDALFLENIREWLGPTTGKVPKADRETVNEAIAKTLESAPKQFLARNNGITFRASDVQKVDEKTLKLSEASIVNGCQTTMSIVNHLNGDIESHTLLKIVETDDAWDIAGAANFQTKVDRIDLDVARYIRPQAISAAADKYGVGIRKADEIPDSIFSVFRAISRAEVTESEIRALFIGLFSRTPNNAIEINYTELRTDLLDDYDADPNKDNLLYTLFTINEVTQQAGENLERMSSEVKEFFRRFWDSHTKKTPNYRAFLTILAACGCTGENWYADDRELDYRQLTEYLDQVRSIVENEPSKFQSCYQDAFTALAVKVIDIDSDPAKIIQQMASTIKRARFEPLYLIYQTLQRDN